jgi:DNA polymerase-3 subunit delta
VPALSLAALKKQIADGKLASIYLFVGDDVKLVDRMVEAIESTVDAADRPFAVERIYAGDVGGTPMDITSAARILPMLGDRRIVIVLRAERLLKPKRASKAAKDGPEDEADGDVGEGETAMDAGPIEDYLAAPVPSSTLVFVASDVDRTRKLTKKVLEKAQVVEFKGLGEAGGVEGRGGVAAWLREELTRSGRDIEPEAARMLVSRSAGDITKLRGDVERVLLFIGTRPIITVDDIREVVSDQMAVDDEWGVVNAIAEGNAARALVEAVLRLDRGDSVHALVGQLRWWVANRLSQSAPNRVRPAIEALLRTDLALKSSGGDERVLLERLVVELTGGADGRATAPRTPAGARGR